MVETSKHFFSGKMTSTDIKVDYTVLEDAQKEPRSDDDVHYVLDAEGWTIKYWGGRKVQRYKLESPPVDAPEVMSLNEVTSFYRTELQHWRNSKDSTSSFGS